MNNFGIYLVTQLLTRTLEKCFIQSTGPITLQIVHYSIIKLLHILEA